MNASGHPVTRSLIGWFLRYRRWCFFLGFVFIALAWPVSQRLAFDQSIESMYADDDPHLLEYQQSKATFGGDEFAIVAFPVENLIDDETNKVPPETAAELRAFSELLSDVPGVNKASTQNLADAMSFPINLGMVRKLLERILLNEAGDTTAIVLRLLPESESPISRGETLAQIRELADNHTPPAFVVGEPVQIHDMFRYVEEDGYVLFAVSLLLLGTVILSLFRSLRWVILPLTVVMASIMWTKAILVLSSMKLSMVSSMMNSLVTIIGISTVTHVTVHFRELRQTCSRQEAMEKTMQHLLPPIFWTCVTTAVGFAALLSSAITPVFSFGTMMALGTFMVLAAVVLLLPEGMMLGRWSVDPRSTFGEKHLITGLTKIQVGVEKHPRWFLFVILSIMIFSAAGFTRLEVETDFSKNFRAESPIVKSLGFVETKLGGAGTWEVNFPTPEALTPKFLAKVERLANRLRELKQPGNEEPALTKVSSVTDGLEIVPSFVRRFSTINTALKTVAYYQPEFVDSLYNPKKNRMRIMLRARERQSSEDKLWLINQVEKLSLSFFPDSQNANEIPQPGARASGIFVLLTFLIESLLRDQLVSFGLAAVGIFLMMSLAFRSVAIGLVSLVPNLFPILLVIGSLGWLGLPINIATAMIASVSMGLTVDSSIHYLSCYRRYREAGETVSAALQATQQQVGLALIFENIALVVGFSVLTLSHFIPLIYFGILINVALLGGLFGNLTLLPLMVQWLAKFEREPTTEILNTQGTEA